MTQDSSREPNDEFFELVDEDEELNEPSDSRSRWLSAGLVLLSVLLAILLCVLGIRALNAAREDEGFEDKTWVMSGRFVDLTPDLQTKSNVAKYSGSLPADQALNGVTFKSDLADAKQVNGGQVVEFRGSQTGETRNDFPQEVDALLAETGDQQVEVVRTGEPGSINEVTSASVRNAKIGGWASLLGAVVVFAAGVTGAVMLNRRARNAHYDDFDFED